MGADEHVIKTNHNIWHHQKPHNMKGRPEPGYRKSDDHRYDRYPPEHFFNHDDSHYPLLNNCSRIMGVSKQNQHFKRNTGHTHEASL